MHPVALKIGSLTIHWYGIMVLVGVVVGWVTTVHRARRHGFDPDHVTELVPWIVIGGLAGARLFFVILFWKEYFADAPLWEIFMINHGGLVFYGGVIGGVIAGLTLVRKRRLPVWQTADLVVPGVAIGYALGRIGCFLNGCCFGRPCDLPWAVRFPDWHASGGLPVHPVQLYEFGWALLAYFFLEWLYKRREFEGQVTGAFILIYSVCRFGTEMFRGDYPPSKYLLGLTPAQVISIPLFLVGVVVLVIRARNAHSQVSQ